MAFVPNTDDDRKEMLESIGVNDFNELIGAIPENMRLQKGLDLPDPLSEYEVVKLIDSYASQNKTASTHVCFMGGGAYDRFIPSIVLSVLERPEFKTAYTPYQAEVSQGTLQSMYEYQSMICALTGMDVSNASMYDGGSALAEAALLANTQNKKTKFLIAGTINPHYRKVLDSITQGKEMEFIEAVDEHGTCDLKKLGELMADDVSAVIVQQPNAYGNIEDVIEIEKIAHSRKSLFVVVVDPISLGMLEAPGNYNADIVVGEGQSLGIPLNYGGPYLGLFAAKKKFVRKLPGRISGMTQDSDGNRGFVLTLQTREQQIKRERATSNICTNQGLFMLAATVYMATMGKEGIREVAEQSFQKAHYLAEEISKIAGFSLANDKPFFCDFLVETPVPAMEILKECEKEGFLGGIDTSRFPECKQGLLISVTEKRTKEEMDRYLGILKKFAK